MRQFGYDYLQTTITLWALDKSTNSANINNILFSLYSNNETDNKNFGFFVTPRRYLWEKLFIRYWYRIF